MSRPDHPLQCVARERRAFQPIAMMILLCGMLGGLLAATGTSTASLPTTAIPQIATATADSEASPARAGKLAVLALSDCLADVQEPDEDERWSGLCDDLDYARVPPPPGDAFLALGAAVRVRKSTYGTQQPRAPPRDA